MEALDLETREKNKHKTDITGKVELELVKIRKTHEFQKESIMKRIRRDRDELLVIRQRETENVIKRAKLQIKDIQEKHTVELKTLVDFMKFSLGKRAPKEDVKKGQQQPTSP